MMATQSSEPPKVGVQADSGATMPNRHWAVPTTGDEPGGRGPTAAQIPEILPLRWWLP